MQTPSLEDLLRAGVHFGHRTSRWHPKMAPYIFTDRHGVHIVDLRKTQELLDETLDVVRGMAKEGKKILFVSTKPQARDIVKEAAIDCGMPYLTGRWLGGLLTNFSEIKKLINKYNTLKEQQASGELERYTKKEQLEFARDIEKMDESIGGLASLKGLPDAIFLPAMQREKTAVTEANTVGIDVIGICDTNANPDKTTHFIPGNDDAINAIKLLVGLVAGAVKEGVAEAPKESGSTAESAAAPNKGKEKTKTATKKPAAKKDAESPKK